VINAHTFIGSTTDLIDWNSIIDAIKDRSDGDFNSVASVMERVDSDIASGNVFEVNNVDVTSTDTEELVESYYDLLGIWTKANYRLADIQWYDYYPHTHFDNSVTDKFSELVNAKPLRTFISKVLPGRIVPYHWDIEDMEIEWNKLGEMVRYVCFMHDPIPGQILALDEYCFYDAPKDAVYQWKSRKNWHAAANCSTAPYYLYHFLGYK
jgi:hypothetical protein